MTDLRGQCGTFGTVPALCVHGHPCCAIHAKENPDVPCLSCRASRAAMHQQARRAQT